MKTKLNREIFSICLVALTFVPSFLWSNSCSRFLHDLQWGEGLLAGASIFSLMARAFLWPTSGLKSSRSSL